MRRLVGFSLIEVLAVLLLMALLGGLVHFTLRGKVAVDKIDEAGRELQFLDQTARARARRFDEPRNLLFDLSQNSVTSAPIDDRQRRRSTVALGAGITIDAIWLVDRPVRHGTLALPISGQGYSTSYGITLRMEHRQTILTRYWMVVGLTGQWIPMNDQDALENTLASLR
ncbi:MAG: hypothetical protein JJU36_05195 [Phycisphaeraceae bacterium]|nr:hypothetical protein [Phycisphaeraceae bacterium]